MSIYSIKDLEVLSGIKAHTLRIWEQRYSILSPQRTYSNIRNYDEQDLKLVLNIALLKDHGYKISEIAKMKTEEIHQRVLAISESQISYPEQIHALTLSMLDLDEDQFEKIVNTNIIKLGFESLIINIIYPFLNRISTLWMTSSIGPAQQHFIANLIRQKIIVAIDGQLNKQREGAHKFLLFLPEGELQELILLFADYLIRSRQNKVVYLGHSLPFEELSFAYNVHKPNYLLTIFKSVPVYSEFQQYLYRLSANFPQARILILCSHGSPTLIQVPENIQFVNQIQDLIRIAEY
jgi:MerR family transcriptional regulator, light-induced transcriptional regulator